MYEKRTLLYDLENKLYGRSMRLHSIYMKKHGSKPIETRIKILEDYHESLNYGSEQQVYTRAIHQ